MQWIPGHKLKNRPYRIEQELGQGGFGITYKARDLNLDVSVVIKTPNRKLQRDRNYQKYVENFIREAKQLAKLGLNPHPNIVRVISLFQEDNLPCIVMDLIPGQSLYDLVLTQGKLSQTQAFKYIRQIGSALVVCHHAGIIHRDVHPNNILIHANSGKAILIDFGISGTTQTSRNTHSGNRCFAPWEQIAYWEGENSKTPQVDIYTLAASLYFLVTAEEPTECLARKYNNSELIAPKQLNAELSDRVDQAILKGLEIEPGDRPNSMQEWLELLLATPQNLITPSGVNSQVTIVQNVKENNHHKYQTQDQANNTEGLTDVEMTWASNKININSEETGDLSSANNKAASTIKNTLITLVLQLKNKAFILGVFIFFTSFFGIYAAYNSMFNVTEIPEVEEPTPEIEAENQEDISEDSTIPEPEEPTSQIPTENQEDISESSQVPEPEASTPEIETQNQEDISESSQVPEIEEIPESETSTNQIPTQSQEDILEESTNQIETDNQEDISEESTIPELEEPTPEIETDNQEDISEESTIPELEEIPESEESTNQIETQNQEDILEEPTPEIETQSQEDISEVSEFELIATLDSDSSLVKSIAFSPDSKILASSDRDTTIKLWDVANQQEIATLTGHSKIVNSVAFNLEDEILASGSSDSTIKVWNLDTQQEIATLTGHLGSVNSVAFSPDGKILASGSSDSTIKVWNLDTQQEIATLTGHPSDVNSVAFSPDGKVLASGSYNNTIKVWNTNTLEEIVTLTGHLGVVNLVAFSPNGKVLASGSWDSTTKVWNLDTKQEIATLTGHPSDVNSVAFSPDGKILASGDSGNTIKLWKIPSDLR